MQKGDLIIVAGRPSMGKTTFSLNIAENAAFGAKQAKVGVFSMEMSREQLAFRMVSSLGRVDQTKLRTGQLGRRRLVAHQLRHHDDEVVEHLYRRHRRRCLLLKCARARAA